MHIVVYGTLKSGYWNNTLLANAKLVGSAVVENYCLYDGGFPVAQPMEGASIEGELWYINDGDTRTVANCDRLEGTPNFYSREPVEAMLDTGEKVAANMYVGTIGSFSDLSKSGRRPPCPLNKGGHHEWNSGRR